MGKGRFIEDSMLSRKETDNWKAEDEIKPNMERGVQTKRRGEHEQGNLFFL
jgi:hypothetical protein